MINACLELLFGCPHRHQSRPFTLNRHCYIVCLDCGHETPYSWREMHPMTRADQRAASELDAAAAA